MIRLKIFAVVMYLVAFCAVSQGCTVNRFVASSNETKSSKYVWHQVTNNAAYPQTYNYPVFSMNGKMFALQNGGWL